MFQKLFQSINWVDIFIVILLIRGSYIGIRHGFLPEVFKTIGFIAAIVLSISKYQQLGGLITTHTLLPIAVSNVVAFILLAVAVLFVFRILRLIVQHFLVNVEVMSGLERFGGVVIGSVRSVIITSLVLFILTLVPRSGLKDSVHSSLLGPHFLKVTSKIYNFVIRFYPAPALKESTLIIEKENPGGKQ